MKSTGSILTSIGKEAIGRNDLKIMIGMSLSLGLQLVAHFPGPQIRIHVLKRTRGAQNGDTAEAAGHRSDKMNCPIRIIVQQKASR
jgi:hypothetical protein